MSARICSELLSLGKGLYEAEMTALELCIYLLPSFLYHTYYHTGGDSTRKIFVVGLVLFCKTLN